MTPPAAAPSAIRGLRLFARRVAYAFNLCRAARMADPPVTFRPRLAWTCACLLVHATPAEERAARVLVRAKLRDLDIPA